MDIWGTEMIRKRRRYRRVRILQAVSGIRRARDSLRYHKKNERIHCGDASGRRAERVCQEGK